MQNKYPRNGYRQIETKDMANIFRTDKMKCVPKFRYYLLIITMYGRRIFTSSFGTFFAVVFSYEEFY